MFIHDVIDEKIHALTTMKGVVLDETDGQDLFTHMEMRDFAEDHDGLLFFIEDEHYLILEIIGERDFLIIPVDYSLQFVVIPV